MKIYSFITFYLIAISVLLLITTKVTAQIKVSTNGFVTIGDTYTASEKMEVSGRAKFRCNAAASSIVFENYYSSPVIKPQEVTNFGYLGMSNRRFANLYCKYVRYEYLVQSSDFELKENIRMLDSSLENLCLLKPVLFDYKSEIYDFPDNYSREKDLINRKNHSGFIAQDVQKVFPKLVHYNEDSDYLELNYIGLIPELVRAVQEQQEIIDSLSIIIKELHDSNSLKSISTDITHSAELEGTLLQNAPNPFNSSTYIKYNIEDGANSAMINIYNPNGKQLKSYKIATFGYGELHIPASTFEPGMYFYNLLVDGYYIDSKQMIITD